MEFLEILKELVDSVPGGIAATIMGMDGLPIRQYSAGSFDVETVGVEYGKVIEETRHASNVLNLGTVEEIIVATAGSKLVLRVITPEYYLAFVLADTANMGRARYLLKKAALKAEKELSA